MSDFLEQDGMKAFISAVKSFEGTMKIEDVVCQTKLVTSFRAVVNNKRGIDALIESKGGADMTKNLVKMIAESKNVMMRTQIVELMAAMCLYSQSGHEVVLESLGEASGGDSFRVVDESMRFSIVSRWLRDDSEASAKMAVVSLINSIISAPSSIEKRMKLRSQFTHLNIHESLEALKIQATEQCEQELVSQIDVFFKGSSFPSPFISPQVIFLKQPNTETKSDANELRRLTTESPIDLT